ncbi:alpha/beta hydrolase [uncultured Rhodoblastus sp.]|uniref:alpha/beta hydrolase n=1 Tax=uncultured Rhodoblastus sp. TaxID=543037 RepID=UPI0025F91001|nr:alpha/beta hydrolase [uncultured Rhodoblastus sp.]
MPRRLLLTLACLSFGVAAPFRALAVEARLAFPSAYSGDVFVKSLLSSKILAQAGVTLIAKQQAGESAAMGAVKTGAADIGVFTLADEDLRKLQTAGSEASLLTRPFVFQSAKEVFLMQNSFLGDATATGAGRSGLFPLQLWNHAITYFLTREPIRSTADFAKLTVAADKGAPDVKILNSLGAKISQSRMSMKEGATNALETQLGAATRDFAKKFGGKLYLTVGWPETGLLAAAPDFWLKLSEAQKNALKIAAKQAREAADAELMAREEAIVTIPNVELTHLDQRMDMTTNVAGKPAMRKEGDSPAAMGKEMELWRKAEVEVHSPPAPALQNAAPPAPEQARKMAARSPVFFVTDRNDEATLDYKTRFGARRLDPFEYTCGYLGAPARNSGEPQIPPAPKTLIKGVEECAKLIVAKTREAGGSKVMFVIHGFNISFDSLLWRALQLGSEAEYDGAIVGWSWPSEGSAFGYAYDEDSSAWSEPHLVELVNEIATAGPELQLDFVAHSMGNRMLLQMLREFALAKSGLRIGAAIFAAPDVAQDVFRDQIRMVRKIGAIRTLYASQYDRAILISESYHRAPRAGSGGDNILVTGGVESVDARLGGHSYVFDEPKAIQDFKQILNQATMAGARGLEAKEKAGAAYWVIQP